MQKLNQINRYFQFSQHFLILLLLAAQAIGLPGTAQSRSPQSTSPQSVAPQASGSTSAQPATPTGTAGGAEFERATTLVKQRRFKEAIAEYQRAYAKNQRLDACSMNIARCYDVMGDSQKAQQYYQFVVDHWPDSEVAAAARPHLAQMAAIQTMPKIWSSFHRGGQGHMYVPAVMNGQQLTMMFDTGAAVCFATTSQLQRFGIPLSMTASKGRVIGVGGEAETKMATVELIVCGIKRNINLVIQDDHSQMQARGFEEGNVPLLGQTFFGDLAIEIDGNARRIALASPQTTPIKDKDMAVPFTREQNLIIVKPKIMGRECEMILDTGAAGVSFTERQFSAFGFIRPIDAGRSHSIGVGGRRDNFQFPLRNMQLGPITKEIVDGSLDLDGRMSNPLLGESFLENLHFTIEPQLKQIVFYKQ